MTKTIGLLLFISLPLYANEKFASNEYLVKVKKQYANLSENKIMDLLKVDRVEKISSLQRWHKIVTTKPIASVKSNQAVEYIEPNYYYYLDRRPDDSNYKYQWGIKNIGQQDNDGNTGEAGVDIDVEDTWDVTTGSNNVVVAVIDTGIDLKHKDLKNNIWINEKELNGKEGVDDDGNGYTDDVNGYSFDESTSSPKDDHGHGTHCAGVIGAKGNDAIGIAGVNWKVKLMAVKFLSKDGRGTLDGALKSIVYAVDNGAKILSNSWGGGAESQAMKDAISYSLSKGALFVAAAGNNGSDTDLEPHFPSSYDVGNVISVAAINNLGNLADFSNFGIKSVDIAAPGVNILSTLPTDIYEDWSGTSMATPFVSGVAALMLSVNSAMGPLELKEKILRSSKPLSKLNGKVLTSGMLNARGAVALSISK